MDIQIVFLILFAYGTSCIQGMAKELIEIDPFHDADNGKEQASHRNLGNGVRGCWWDCLVF